MPDQLLTHSRQDTFKTCRRKHFFAYELGIRPTEEAKALRMGSSYHDALECLENGGTLDTAVELIRNRYAAIIDPYDQLALDYECETVLRLICGYVWRWDETTLKFIAAELPFEMPLLNPETDAASKVFKLAGKIDGIVELPDGRLAVIEHKLLGEDIGSDGDLWRRLRIDHQISLYVLAARRLGYPVDCVLYNATQKPTIKPTNVPILDKLGMKIVLDARGERVVTGKGQFRQTGDSEKGYVLQQRPMVPDEWGNKLADDIAARPDWYYARNEIPRLDQDLAEFETELWDIQKVIRDAQWHDRHYKTCNKNTCSWCPYFGICTSGWKKEDALPEGFVRVEDTHPELMRVPV